VWSDVVGEIDLLIYASLQLQRSQLPSTKRNLLALSVSRVALWDFDAAERLLGGRPQDLLAPEPILVELARDRGWSDETPIALLPLIERRRLELLKSTRRFLKLPLEIDGGVISDAEDLEIGHLAYTVSRSAADPRLKQKLQRLRRVRNHLAHMEVLDLALAWHDDIYGSY
jgi:hypothetical protein